MDAHFTKTENATKTGNVFILHSATMILTTPVRFAEEFPTVDTTLSSSAPSYDLNYSTIRSFLLRFMEWRSGTYSSCTTERSK